MIGVNCDLRHAVQAVPPAGANSTSRPASKLEKYLAENAAVCRGWRARLLLKQEFARAQRRGER